MGGRCLTDWTRCLACSSGRNLFHVLLERMKVESSAGAASVRAREAEAVTAPSFLGTKENLDSCGTGFDGNSDTRDGSVDCRRTENAAQSRAVFFFIAM